MRNVMIDLETLSLAPMASIVSIGMVEFDSTGVGRKFYHAVKDAPGRIDYQTVRWWMNQSEAARGASFSKEVVPVTLTEALFDMRLTFHVWNAEFVWAKPSNFDLPILSWAFESVDSSSFWNHRNTRDARTLVALAGMGVDDLRPSSVAHDALEDAIAQAHDCIEAAKRLGVVL